MKIEKVAAAQEGADQVYKNDSVEIRFEKLYSLVTVFWKRQISFEERKAGYEVVYLFIKRHQATSLLINNKNIFLFTPQEKSWVAATLNAWIVETGIRKMAMVTSDLYKNLTDLTEYVDYVKHNHELLAPIAHEFFMDHETALVWIKEPLAGNE